tara:strand:- start:20 stop:313 length:294 start_codon:yes stop_codon:yes gene_type:complete
VSKKNLTKQEISQYLSLQTGFSKSFSNKIVNDIISIIILNIKKGNFKLKNIGSFKLLHKNERIGRNPKTNEEFIIKSRKSISFIPSKKILKILDQNK